MRLRNVTGAEELIAKSKYVCNEPEIQRGKWNIYFKNGNPIHIEIGMGKGQFITNMSKLHPEINYIGIEKYASVLYRAVQKIEEEEVPNLVFVCMNAEDLEKVFQQEEVDRIYLNFSDPWPKERHARRRLPSKEYLKRYDFILKRDGQLEFKTDNRGLFLFAEEELEQARWKKDKVTYDLHHDAEMMIGNVMTEYEKKFSSMGNPIYKYIISREDERKS